jgi:hypothetical protein
LSQYSPPRRAEAVSARQARGLAGLTVAEAADRGLRISGATSVLHCVLPAAGQARMPEPHRLGIASSSGG